MNNTLTKDGEITHAFRWHMSHFGCTGYPGHYEYADGELWYMGDSLQSRMTPNEKKCLEYVLKEARVAA